MTRWLMIAQAGAEVAKRGGDSSRGFVSYIPLLVMLVMFAWLAMMLRRNQRRFGPLHQRSLDHMDRMEAKTDEMLAVLKEIRDRAGREG
jgi:hypothetical protein